MMNSENFSINCHKDNIVMGLDGLPLKIINGLNIYGQKVSSRNHLFRKYNIGCFPDSIIHHRLFILFLYDTRSQTYFFKDAYIHC